MWICVQSVVPAEMVCCHVNKEVFCFFVFFFGIERPPSQEEIKLLFKLDLDALEGVKTGKAAGTQRELTRRADPDGYN